MGHCRPVERPVGKIVTSYVRVDLGMAWRNFSDMNLLTMSERGVSVDNSGVDLLDCTARSTVVATTCVANSIQDCNDESV